MNKFIAVLSVLFMVIGVVFWFTPEKPSASPNPGRTDEVILTPQLPQTILRLPATPPNYPYTSLATAVIVVGWALLLISDFLDNK